MEHMLIYLQEDVFNPVQINILETLKLINVFNNVPNLNMVYKQVINVFLFAHKVNIYMNFKDYVLHLVQLE